MPFTGLRQLNNNCWSHTGNNGWGDLQLDVISPALGTRSHSPGGWLWMQILSEGLIKRASKNADPNELKSIWRASPLPHLFWPIGRVVATKFTTSNTFCFYPNISNYCLFCKGSPCYEYSFQGAFHWSSNPKSRSLPSCHLQNPYRCGEQYIHLLLYCLISGQQDL